MHSGTLGTWLVTLCKPGSINSHQRKIGQWVNNEMPEIGITFDEKARN